ncbi:ferredoxin [Amycolatopsis antarctica]|uniref:Ferredoxin n=1 Tax=Amycolatopsis antarctica TaxID=1854586 RepID=A0A263D082_9PSEU|nr:(4Fe-4S)-binding protein [Amycolatopsis antarctica]OZM71538.1 ferredoxin [Amycolatopsis antarctica]
MTVRADRDRCIGAGMCVLTAPEAFDQDEEGIVLTLLDRPDGEAAEEAARACPSGALVITN